jgi:hypothetical protein
MTVDDLLKTIAGITDFRLAQHVELVSRALVAPTASLQGGNRAIPAGELLDIYRVRRDLAVAGTIGADPEALRALVELFEAAPTETWRIFPVDGAGVGGGVFVSSGGRCGCYARPH